MGVVKVVDRHFPSRARKAFMQGNEAVVEGAIAAGARFFAGYPITPSSEIAESAARRLPQVGGWYVQMEDEIASMAAIIGASLAGTMSFTATSGPGFSLMQENLGAAVAAEVPCVVVDVQRTGPSTGIATKVAQADVMQARWGRHGDQALIALAPASVQECFDLTYKAFSLSERFRVPVVLLSDQIVGQLRESLIIPDDIPPVERRLYTGPPDQYMPFQVGPDLVPMMAHYGGEAVFHVTTTMHDETGADSRGPDNTRKQLSRMWNKIYAYRREISMHKEFYNDEGSDALIISYGSSARAARQAALMARQAGRRVAVLQLLTLWPFPDEVVEEVASGKKVIFVAELNLGQVVSEVKRVLGPSREVHPLLKFCGEGFDPIEILEQLEAPDDGTGDLS